MAAHSTQVEIGGRKLTLETGRVAKQADGSLTTPALYVGRDGVVPPM